MTSINMLSTVQHSLRAFWKTAGWKHIKGTRAIWENTLINSSIWTFGCYRNIAQKWEKKYCIELKRKFSISLLSMADVFINGALSLRAASSKVKWWQQDRNSVQRCATSFWKLKLFKVQIYAKCKTMQRFLLVHLIS